MNGSLDRAVLKDILENALPATAQDVVIVVVRATGAIDGRRTELTDARRIVHQEIDGEPWTAIQITTAAGICAAVDLHAKHARFDRGFVRQEQIELKEFLSNRFGRYYASSKRETADNE